MMNSADFRDKELRVLVGMCRSFGATCVISSSLNMETVLFSRIYVYICQTEPPLWSSRQSSWLQIQRSGFDPLGYQIFCKVVGLERGPLSLVSTIEELLGINSSGPGLENRDYGRRDPPL
jgi:hypothetical protein